MKPGMKQIDAEAAVVGGGPAGLVAAIALAAGGVTTAFVTGRPGRTDNRTSALLAASVMALDTLGVWTDCRAQAAPLRRLRIVDDTTRLWRAPEVRFDAAELGIEAFGWNVENRHLVAALGARVRILPDLTIIEDDATELDLDGARARLALSGGGSVTARLVVAADGRQSLCRSAAGIDTEQWRYPQTAVTLNFAHTRPHHDTSTEFHTEQGPFTVVPLPGKRSSLVCVVTPDEAARLKSLDNGALAAEIEQRAHSILGKVEVEDSRGVFPLTAQTARRFGVNRVALIGEAAHVIPPIGAQGLNLGIRDAATIAEMAVEAHRQGKDIGSQSVVEAYDAARRGDVGSRTLAVDLLNRTLLSDLLPAQGLRGIGLYLLDRIGPLRRTIMREGIAPSISQPRLLRGEAL
jgi:2-octaprenyl-6-methoxyphenol hydroxylase